MSNGNVCKGGKVLVYSCSGAADVGDLADRTVRKLSKETEAKMYCLPALGAHLDPFLKNAESADRSIAVDGCPAQCAKKLLDHVGLESVSFVLTEMGCEKGKTEVNEELIEEMKRRIAADTGL